MPDGKQILNNEEEFLQYGKEVEVVSSPLKPNNCNESSDEELTAEELLDFGDPLDHSSDEYVPSDDSSSGDDINFTKNRPKTRSGIVSSDNIEEIASGPSNTLFAENNNIDQNEDRDALAATDENEDIAIPTENISVTEDHETQQNEDNPALRPAKKRRGRKQVEGEGTRKRKRNSSTWERNVRQRKKNRGEEYTTIKGRLKPAKTIHNPCNCKKNAMKNLTR